MDVQQGIAIRSANSMRVFADGEPTFVLGRWREWQQACIDEGRVIQPAEFKARAVQERKTQDGAS